MKTTMRLLAAGFALCATGIAQATLNDIGLDYAGDTAEEGKKGLTGTLGIVEVLRPEYSGSDKTDLSLMPLINIDYNDSIYFRFNRAGAWLLKFDSWRVGLVGVLQRDRDSGSADELDGTDDRDSSFNVGPNFVVNLPYGKLDGRVVTDITGNSDGTSAEGGYQLPLVNKPGVANVWMRGAVEWQSSEVTDFYYGIKPNEDCPDIAGDNDKACPAGLNRPRYRAGNAVNWKLAAYASVNMTKNWVALLGGSYTKFDENISDSPIVEGSSDLMGFLGLGWNWTY